MEHRWGARIAVHMPIRLKPIYSPLEGIGRMIDLSVSGGFIADFDIRLLSRIQVSFDSPLWSNPEILPAYVSRRGARGIGVEWCEFAPQPVKELLRAARISQYVLGTREIQTLATPIRSIASMRRQFAGAKTS
jgi:hypothetical protein